MQVHYKKVEIVHLMCMNNNNICAAHYVSSLYYYNDVYVNEAELEATLPVALMLLIAQSLERIIF
jgi:hypothetical protein